MDLVIVSLSAVDVVLDLAAAGSLGSFPPSLLKVAKIFRVLRMGRVLKLIKVDLISTNFSNINVVISGVFFSFKLEMLVSSLIFVVLNSLVFYLYVDWTSHHFFLPIKTSLTSFSNIYQLFD